MSVVENLWYSLEGQGVFVNNNVSETPTCYGEEKTPKQLLLWLIQQEANFNLNCKSILNYLKSEHIPQELKVKICWKDSRWRWRPGGLSATCLPRRVGDCSRLRCLA